MKIMQYSRCSNVTEDTDYPNLPFAALSCTADESPFTTSRKKSGGLLCASHSYPAIRERRNECHKKEPMDLVHVK